MERARNVEERTEEDGRRGEMGRNKGVKGLGHMKHPITQRWPTCAFQPNHVQLPR